MYPDALYLSFEMLPLTLPWQTNIILIDISKAPICLKMKSYAECNKPPDKCRSSQDEAKQGILNPSKVVGK